MSDNLPDPSEVEAVNDNEGVYERDADGNLQPGSWHVIEYDGGYKKVRPYPIPTGDFAQFENMGHDVEMERLAGIMENKFETPDRTKDKWLDTDPELFMACMNLLVEIATGEKPSSEFHAQVQEELQKRDGAEGN